MCTLSGVYSLRKLLPNVNLFTNSFGYRDNTRIVVPYWCHIRSSDFPSHTRKQTALETLRARHTTPAAWLWLCLLL